MIVYFNNDGVMTLQIQHGSPVIRQGSNFDIDFLFETNCPYLQNKTLGIHFKKYGEKEYEQIEYLLDNPDTYIFHKLDGENAYTLVEGKEYTRYRFESQSNYNLTTKFGELEAILSIYEIVEMSDSIFPPSTTTTKIYATGLIHLYVEKTYGIEPKNLNISPTQYSYLISYLTSIRNKNVEDIEGLADLINNNLISSITEDQIIYPITRAKILQLFNKSDAEAVNLIDLFVEDGDISTAKLADGAVTLIKLNSEVENHFAKTTDNNQVITAKKIIVGNEGDYDILFGHGGILERTNGSGASTIHHISFSGDDLISIYSDMEDLALGKFYENGSIVRKSILSSGNKVELATYDESNETSEHIVLSNANGIEIDTTKDLIVSSEQNSFRFKNGVLEVSDDWGETYSPYALKPYVDAQIGAITLTAGTGIQISGGRINATGLTTSIVEHYVTVNASTNDLNLSFSLKITNNSTNNIQTYSALTDAMTSANKSYRLDCGYFNGIYLDKAVPNKNSSITYAPLLSEDFAYDGNGDVLAHTLECQNRNSFAVTIEYKVDNDSWSAPTTIPAGTTVDLIEDTSEEDFKVIGYFVYNNSRSEFGFLNMTIDDISKQVILDSVYKISVNNQIVLKARTIKNNNYETLDIKEYMIESIIDDKLELS